jgi:hypothetical protein
MVGGQAAAGPDGAGDATFHRCFGSITSILSWSDPGLRSPLRRRESLICYLSPLD